MRGRHAAQQGTVDVEEKQHDVLASGAIYGPNTVALRRVRYGGAGGARGRGNLGATGGKIAFVHARGCILPPPRRLYLAVPSGLARADARLKVRGFISSTLISRPAT